MPDGRHQFLLVISDRDALGWILSEQRMAFAPSRYKAVGSLSEGDQLVLYTTRGCFRNPTRDRGRVIAIATVTSPVDTLDRPVTFSGREFGRGCTLRIERLAPEGKGPELGDLVAQLHTFPPSWRMHIRRTLIPIDSRDYRTLERALSKVKAGSEPALPTYLNKIQVRDRRSARSA